MKRLRGLWPKVTAFSNLYTAYAKARRGKRDRPEVAAFGLELEHNLLSLQRQLTSGRYRPGKYRLFSIFERKPRQIAAAPFRDRVVQHAVMNIVEPLIDPRFIYDSFACRSGKGTHQAIRRYRSWAARYRYTMKLDIRSYFPSIDRHLLSEELARYLYDRSTLSLLRLIIDTGPPVAIRNIRYFPGDDLFTPVQRTTGIPIGNLTSQFFANLYLNRFDHWVKETLRVRAYLRYVDDMVFLADSKDQLYEWKRRVEKELEGLRLEVHQKKALVQPSRLYVDLLGYRVAPNSVRLRDDNGHRFSRRLRGWSRAFSQGTLKWEDFNPRVQSWLGHAGHADTHGLRKSIFAGVVFRRGQAR